jgi:hypothetical protein
MDFRYFDPNLAIYCQFGSIKNYVQFSRKVVQSSVFCYEFCGVAKVVIIIDSKI